MNNEFMGRRVVKASFTITNSSASTVHSTGIYIPAGAIVTGITWENRTAVTKTNASGTVVVRAGTANLCATVNVSTLPAETVAASTAVALTRVPAVGELQIVEGASATSAATGTYTVYVDYIYVA